MLREPEVACEPVFVAREPVFVARGRVSKCKGKECKDGAVFFELSIAGWELLLWLRLVSSFT